MCQFLFLCYIIMLTFYAKDSNSSPYHYSWYILGENMCLFRNTCDTSCHDVGNVDKLACDTPVSAGPNHLNNLQLPVFSILLQLALESSLFAISPLRESLPIVESLFRKNILFKLQTRCILFCRESLGECHSHSFIFQQKPNSLSQN